MPPHSSRAEWIAATVTKSGNHSDENEDAAAAESNGRRFAVSDGATEGWESGRWAAHLVAAFIARTPTPANFAEWLTETRANWIPADAAESVPWYATVKQEQGSFATLLGLELLHTKWANEWTWKAVAVGDSCLVHVRGGEVKAAFPLTSSGAFGNQPPLVPSASDGECPEPEWLAGRAEPGDLFLLATDAAAARLLDPAAPGRRSPRLANRFVPANRPR